MTTTRILGYAPLEDLDGLLAMMNAVAGPTVEAIQGPALAALVQPHADDTQAPISQAAAELIVQRRLEIACLAGPFLPQEPASALIPADALRGALPGAWGALETALSTHGHHHQWDILLRWSPDEIVRRQAPALSAARSKYEAAETVRAALQSERQSRQAQLLNALSPEVLAFAAGGPSGTGTEVLVTTLVEAHAEWRMEAALATLDGNDPWIDLRGPLPPVAFAPVQAIYLSTAELDGAWQTLDLPRRIDRTGLHQQWRTLAASVNPHRPTDTLSGAAPGISGLTDAYRLLRAVLPTDGREASLSEILSKAGWRLSVPDAPARVSASARTTAPVRPMELELAS